MMNLSDSDTSLKFLEQYRHRIIIEQNVKKYTLKSIYKVLGIKRNQRQN